jgi:23S rRNA (uracil1939-C5)-methyltransferase
MRRRRNLPIIKELEIIDLAAEGKSIGKAENKVVFVAGLVPGDIADVQITNMRKQYMEGYAIRLSKESDLRIKPFCAHFGVCGGCKWQHLPYEKQLEFKQKQVVDSLERIAKVDLPAIEPIIGSSDQQYYRNKLEFTFSESRWLTDEEIKSEGEIQERRALGFHIPGKFDRVLNIDTCYLQDDLQNQIRRSIYEFTLKSNFSYYHLRANQGLMRNLIVRNTLDGEWMVIVSFAEENPQAITKLMEHLNQSFPQITSLFYVINTKKNDTIHDQELILFSGKAFLTEELDGLKFKIGPKSFFQTNSKQALELYRIALKFAAISENDIIYDLYTGTGTIAAFVARFCKKVIGIEYVPEAIDDAKINAEINSIKNIEFLAGDMKDILNTSLFDRFGRPDVIITDPPRAGMHPDVIQAIIEASPERIVYVSCNPATQARDIQLLSLQYKVAAIQPVDMFPHTHHVENVVSLEKV